MREIKFRVWDKDNKCWYHSPQLVIRPYSGKVNDGATTPNIGLMQYTGLKDKNGKEIYEGDIIHCWGGEYYQGYWEYNQKFVVEFGWTQSMWEMLHVENIEVIGNIHDNPELLEVV